MPNLSIEHCPNLAKNYPVSVGETVTCQLHPAGQLGDRILQALFAAVQILHEGKQFKQFDVAVSHRSDLDTTDSL